MQLIDKNALLDGLINDDPKHMLLYISHFPTVDPVKHGHWKQNMMTDLFTKKHKNLVMCSRCRHTQDKVSAYCGGCGDI